MNRNDEQNKPVKYAVYKGKLVPRDEVVELELKHGPQNEVAPLKVQKPLAAEDIASAVAAGVSAAIKPAASVSEDSEDAKSSETKAPAKKAAAKAPAKKADAEVNAFSGDANK